MRSLNLSGFGMALIVYALSALPLYANCLEDGGLLRSSLNCLGLPTIPKFFDAMTFAWKGKQILVVNDGNELATWDITTPTNPVPRGISMFNIANQGDSDYDLRSFSICDDCRFGIATFKRGIVLFDLGVGQLPVFSAKKFYSGSDPIGGFTFKANDQEYLIAKQLPGDCGDATLYRYNGINSITKVACVSIPGTQGKFYGGVQVEDYVYLGFQDGKIYIHQVQPGPTLMYTGNTLRASLGVSRGFVVDETADLAVTVTNDEGMRIYDVSNPAIPLLKSTTAVNGRIAAIRDPFVWVAEYLGSDSSVTYNISRPTAPVLMDMEFWDPANPWNSHSDECEFETGAVFSHDGTVMYLARFAVVQMVGFGRCPPVDVIFADGFEDGTTGAWGGEP